MSRSLIIAIFLAVFAVVWVLSGSLGSDDAATDETVAASQSDERLFKVKAIDITATSMTDTLRLQGETDAIRSIIIKAETHGAISTIYVKKGDRVKKGQLLFELAENDRTARLTQAKSELKLREAELDAGKKLQPKNLISGNQLEQLKNNVFAARAAVTQIQVEIGHTKIKAAFDGVLNSLHIEKGDFLSIGDPVAELIDDSEIKIIAQVPQQHIARIEVGQTANATQIDDTRITGQIDYISNAAELATRTFTIEATADNSDHSLRLRQSAKVEINLGDTLAQKIPTSNLELAADGSIFVKGLDQSNRVIKLPVKMIRAESDGIWLSGLPENFRLISVGHAFVREGQEVDPVLEINEEKVVDIAVQNTQTNQRTTDEVSE
jgi:multidrug efflux system membrane fusion protein